MNILLVTPWRLSATGGITTVVVRLATEFAKKGHVVTVFTMEGENRLREIEVVGEIPVFGMYLRSPVIQGASVRAWIAWCLFFPLTLWRLHRFLNRQRIEGVIVQYPLPGMVYFGVLRRLSAWKLIVAYQGNDAHDLMLWTAAERRLVQAILSAADTVVGVSETLLEKVTAAFPLLKLRGSVVMPNGAPLDMVEMARAEPPPKDLPRPYLLTVGHVVYRKGMDLVIHALALAKAQGNRMNLVIAGDGPERSTLVGLADRCGVADQIRFVGNQSHEQVLRLMHDCELFVLASRAEGMPLVIAEAMACGKAVIATRVDGVPEIVQDGETGLLVEPDNSHALSAALNRLHGDSVLRERLAAQGKYRALQAYNWETIAHRYLQLINSCRTV